MQCEILANGYLAIRNHVLQAQEKPYELVVHPVVTMTGKVTDAETGKPIANFQLIPGIIWDGRSETYWQRDSAMKFTDGKYERHYSEPEAQLQLQIEAEGYQPAFSEPFKLNDGSRTIDFKLSKADSPFEGNVTNAKDQPVEGVDVVMLGPGSQISLRDGLYDRRQNRNSPHAVSDKNGHFKLPNIEPPYLIVATHAKEGYAEIFTDQTTDNFEVKLIPWARIEGQLMIGDKPGADQVGHISTAAGIIELATAIAQAGPEQSGGHRANVAAESRSAAPSVIIPNVPQRQVVDLQHEVQTAINNQLRHVHFRYGAGQNRSQGKFVFEHVIPGRIAAMREIVMQHGQFWTNTPCYGVLLDVAPGETGKVVIGGTGRPVIGHVDMPLFEGKKFDWSRQRRHRSGSRSRPEFWSSRRRMVHETVLRRGFPRWQLPSRRHSPRRLHADDPHQQARQQARKSDGSANRHRHDEIQRPGIRRRRKPQPRAARFGRTQTAT